MFRKTHARANGHGRLLCVLVLVAAGACGDGAGGGYAIPATTKVLDEATLAGLSAVSADLATFTFTDTTPALAGLAAGDVMVASVHRPLLPYGALRKVVSVEAAAGGVTVQTTAARLGEAIERGRVTGPIMLARAAASARVVREHLIPFYSFNDVALYDHDGSAATRQDRVSATGNVSLDVVPTFDLSLAGFAIDELSLGLEGQLTASLALEAGQGAAFDEVYTLGEEYFEPIVFSIGPVPIVLVPRIEYRCGLAGSVSSHLTTAVTLDVGANVEVGYQDGSFMPQADLTASGALETSQFPDGADAAARVWVGPRLSILLYGLEGPYAQLDGYARAQVATDASPWWELYGGVEARVGLHLGVDVGPLDLDLVDWESDPLGDEVLLAAATGAAPSAQTPIPTWASTYGGLGRDEGVTLAAAADGGAFVGGYSASAGGAWLVRLDHLGQVVWERVIEEIVAIGALTETTDGGCLVGGGGYGTGADLAQLMRLDPNGDLVWARTLAGTKETTIDDLGLMPDGSVVVLGPHGVLADGDFWLARLGGEGDVLWSQTYGGPQEEAPHSLAVTQNGDLVAAGVTWSFGVSYTGMWVIRVDGDGNLRWQSVYDGDGNEHALGIVEAADGSLGVAGDDVSDGLLMKLGATGTLAWAHSYDPGSINDELHALIATQAGGFVAAGVWNFDDNDLWLLEVDGTGQLLRASGYGGAGEDAAGGLLELTGVGHALVVTADGGLLTVGATDSFGAGGVDAWVLKTSSAGEVTFDGASGAHRAALAGTFISAPLVVTPTSVWAQPLALTVGEPSLTLRAPVSSVGTQAVAP